MKKNVDEQIASIKLIDYYYYYLTNTLLIKSLSNGMYFVDVLFDSPSPKSTKFIHFGWNIKIVGATTPLENITTFGNNVLYPNEV